MKKIYTVPIIIITILFFVVSSYSQDDSSYSKDEWTEHDYMDWLVKFNLPNDFHVYKNTKDEFKAGTDDNQFVFQIFGVLGPLSGDIEDMKTSLINDAQFNNVSYKDKDIIIINDQKGFTGVTLFGRNSNNNNIVIWVLDHPSAPIRLHIYFIYSDSYAIKGTLLSFSIQWSFEPI
jgi:hypothetical protein